MRIIALFSLLSVAALAYGIGTAVEYYSHFITHLPIN